MEALHILMLIIQRYRIKSTFKIKTTMERMACDEIRDS
jgi:hypothetical protein